MKNHAYHSMLRISALLFAFLLLFDSGVLFPITKELSEQTGRYVANSIGMYAGVEPNGINDITAELAARERALDEREANLATREIGSRDFGLNGSPDYSTYILSLILFILTVLIVLNYALDFARVRTIKYAR